MADQDKIQIEWADKNEILTSSMDDGCRRTFLDEVVVVPSATNPTASAVTPVLVKIGGAPHMVVGDSLDALKDTNDLASYAFSMRGNDVARGVTPGHALLVRTRMGAFAIDEALLDEIRAR